MADCQDPQPLIVGTVLRNGYVYIAQTSHHGTAERLGKGGFRESFSVRT